MGLFDKLFGRKKQPAPSASELARERLTLMLVHDRLKLTPDLLDRIKEELLAVISKYVEIDESGVDVELTHTEHSDKLVAHMPVKRQRTHFERDVLEPGMGNPLAAAAALAKIHQPAPAPSDAPANPSPAQTTETPASPAETPAAPAAAPAEAAAPAASEAAKPAAAEDVTLVVAETTTSAAGEAASQTTAEAPSPATTETAPPADDSMRASAAPQETPTPTDEASAAPGDAVSAAEGTAPAETPAPAATPTKG